MGADVSAVLDELLVEAEYAYYGTRDYEDDKPEPQVAVGESVLDRDGIAWTFTPFGWVVAGDGRPQQWSQIQMWFDS